MSAGIFAPGEPAHSARFRADTQTHASMAGVNTIPEMATCICCGKRRNMRTGNVKAGKFICHGCNRQVAMSAA